MTAVTDFATLQTAMGEWMYGRTDLSSYFTSFVQNAEARFNYGTGAQAQFPSEALRTRDMVTSSDLTLSSGSVALPATFLEAIRVTAKTDPRRKLEYATPDWLDEIYPSTEATDPFFYTILGSNLIVRPVTTSQVELQFYRTISALTADSASDTNWLITAAPNVYLYAVCLEAAVFIGDAQSANLAQRMYGLMMGAIGGLMQARKRDRFGTQPSRRASGAVA